MTKLEKLRAASDRKVLAQLLGFEPAKLAYLVYKKPAASKYFQFQLPKRSGGTRTINAPADDLKLLQMRLSKLLQDCIGDINDGKKISGAISHGFRRNRSILTNARCHRGKRWVFNADLADFFDTINFGRVRGFFLKNKNFALNPEVATTIAQIACHNNALPQGSPCSPVISNLVAHILDIRLAKLAEKHGCDYSRYADDLTFSTNKPEFPTAIAERGEKNEHEWSVGEELDQVIENSWFAVNPKKTRMQYYESRQDVTGLVVNTKVNVRREYERMARAMTRRLRATGSFDVSSLILDANGKHVEETKAGSLNQLRGILSFVDQVKKSNWNKSNPRPEKRVGYERTYREFLIYTEFYAAEKPLILCEGKTDNIYIRCAIRSLIAKVPKLASKSGKEIAYKIRFMSYTKTTARMLGLSGGLGDLTNLIGSYNGEWKKLSLGHKKNPVIIITDNDKAAKNLFGAVAKIIGKKVDGSERLIHVCHNLYVVPIPKPKSVTSRIIEDLFDPSELKKKNNGKVFNPDNNTETDTEYGKYTFAERVIRPNQDKVDFSKFLPLLRRIEAAITHYSSQP